jgi:hypothetical protein
LGGFVAVLAAFASALIFTVSCAGGGVFGADLFVIVAA